MLKSSSLDKFIKFILCFVCHLSSEEAEDENKYFKNEDWKADSEIREVGADMVNKYSLLEAGADMVNRYSMLMCFGSWLHELINVNIPERYKCDNQLEMINFNFALKTAKVFKILLIGPFWRFN